MPLRVTLQPSKKANAAAVLMLRLPDGSWDAKLASQCNKAELKQIVRLVLGEMGHRGRWGSVVDGCARKPKEAQSEE